MQRISANDIHTFLVPALARLGGEQRDLFQRRPARPRALHALAPDRRRRQGALRRLHGRLRRPRPQGLQEGGKHLEQEAARQEPTAGWCLK